MATRNQWYIALVDVAPADGNTVLVQNRGTAQYLDADPDGSVNQSVAPRLGDQWIISTNADGESKLRNAATDRLLNANNGDVDTNGDGGPSQLWSINADGDAYQITSIDAGLLLDADGADQGYNVDLASNSTAETRWDIFVLDTDLGCITETFTEINDLLGCVSADDALVHLQALQDIADANNGLRTSGTPGYDASADYVAGLLEDAGYDVTRQVFDFSLFTENSSSVTLAGADIETQTFSFSGSGDIVDGNVVAVDLDLGLDNASTSGCEPDDFIGLDFSGPNDVALMQRGACAFADKAVNAQAAGAEGAIIFNQGNTPDRVDIIGGTLGAGVVGTVTIPVLDLAYDNGVLVNDSETVSVSADTTIVTSTTENIIADMAGVNTDNVVMAGAHLDSVATGPGIQDNGSGSAAILAVALALAGNDGFVPQNSMRFAWWGAEESGLIGSNEYIFNPDFGISDEDYAALALYLNFDMIASPNYVYGVYDADQSTFAPTVPIPEGSEALEDLFEAYYSIEGIPYDDSEFSGRSDYQAFINVNIPASGLFTGAEGIKTDEQAAIWAGTVGDQYDNCYHLACDTIDNVGYEPLEVNIDAVAYAIFNVAGSTEAVNGVPGANVRGITPDEVDFDGPQGTFVTPADGGASKHYPGGEPS